MTDNFEGTQHTLREYLKRNDLTIKQFSEMTKVSIAVIYRLVDNPSYNLRIDVARKIYHATEDKFGVGLGIWEYIRL